MSENNLSVNTDYAKLYFRDENPKTTDAKKVDNPVSLFQSGYTENLFENFSLDNDKKTPTLTSEKTTTKKEEIKSSYTMPNPHRVRNKKAEERKEKAKIVKNVFEKTKKQQKWLGNAWDWTKNLFGDKDGSNNVAQKISEYEKGHITLDETINTFKGYAEGQEQVVDTTANIVGGAVAFGCYTYALGGAAAAPFTGGASLTQTAVAIGCAGSASATARIAIKGSNSENYSYKDALSDIGKGCTDGLIAPAVAGTQLLAIKGLAKAGMPAAQSALASIENQIVIGFGKSTTKTATIQLASTLSDITSESFNSGGIGIQINKETLNQMTQSQARELSKVLFGNASKETIGHITMQAAHMTANTSATPLIGEGVKIGLIQKTAFSAARGMASGATFGAIKGGSDYAINSATEGTPFSMAHFGQHIAFGATSGAIAGSVLNAGGTLVNETAKVAFPSIPKLSLQNNTTLTSSEITETTIAKLQPPLTPLTTTPVIQSSSAITPIIGTGAVTPSISPSSINPLPLELPPLIPTSIEIRTPSLDLLKENSIAGNLQASTSETIKTDIFYVNDVHGQIPMMEKLVTASGKFDELIKTKGSDALKVSAGDIMLGENPATIRTSVQFLELAGIDVATMGNHEMDAGFISFKKNIADTRTLFLGTNMNFPTGADDRIVYSSVKEINGNKYGFLGIQPCELVERLKNPASMAGVTVDSIDQTIIELQEHINELQRQGIDKIILLSHAGQVADKQIASRTEGLDIIIGGHSHDLIESISSGNNLIYSKSGEPVVITQAGRDGENFGVLSLEFDNHGIIKTAQNSVYDTRRFDNNSTMSDFVNEQFGKPEIIGNTRTLTENFGNTITEENPYAEFMLDAMREKSDTDIAFVNGGLFRGVLNSGEVTDREISNLIPFKDKFAKIELTETELVDALKFCAKSVVAPDKKPGLLQCSGIEYTVNSQGELVNLSFIDKSGNKQIIDINNPSIEKKYTCLYNDFLSNGGDGFSMLKKSQEAKVQTCYDLESITIEKIKSTNTTINFDTDGRIQILK